MSADGRVCPFPGAGAGNPIRTAQDAAGVARAVLGRVLVGERAELHAIPATLFGEPLRALWREAGAILQRGETLDPVALAAAAGVDPVTVAALIDPSAGALIRHAARGVALLRAYAADRSLRHELEAAARTVAAGDGAGAALQAHAALQQFTETTAASLAGRLHDATGWRTATGAPWIVPGFLQRGSLTLLSASGGTGKSLFTLALAARLAAGGGGRHLALDLPDAPEPVLLLDAECGGERIDRRLRELELGGELPAAVIERAAPALYIVAAGTLPHTAGLLDRLPGIMAELPDARVLIADPLRAFLPDAVEDENQARQMGRVLDELVAFAKRSGLAVLVIDHDNRAGGAARGSSAKRDAAEFLWHFTTPDPNDPAYTDAVAEKHRDPGGPLAFAYRLDHDDRTPDGLYPVRFEPVERRTLTATPEGEAVRRSAAVRRAVDTLHARTGGGVSVRALAAEAGLSQTTAYRLAVAMAAAGLLYRPATGSGFYPPSAAPDDREGGDP